MTLRLSLVIAGDASGSKEALRETKAAVDDLGKAARETGKAFEAETLAEVRARSGMKETAAEAQQLAREQGAVEAASRRAAGGIGETGGAAAIAARELGRFRGAALGVVTGLVGGVALGAVAGAFTAATAAAIGFFREVTSNAPLIDRAISAHEDLVDRVAAAYRRARGAASDYGVESRPQLVFEAQQDITRQRDAFGAAQSDLLGAVPLGRPSGLFGLPSTSELIQTRIDEARLGPFAEEVRRLREDLRAGTADVIAFRKSIHETAMTLPEDSPWRRVAEDIKTATDEAADSQARLFRAVDILKGLTGDAEAAATALGGTAEKMTLSGEAAAGAIPYLAEYDRLLGSISGRGDANFTPIPPGARPFADGGLVSGPGTGTSDSILALVSTGEFVVNAAATARHRPLLEAINGSAPRFAAGGIVPRLASGGVVTGGGGNALVGEFDLLAGAARDFAGSLREGRDFMDALSGAARHLTDRMIDLAFSALDRLIFGGGIGSGGGFMGALSGAFAGGTTGFTGFYADGGFVPAGMWGIAGEQGPERVFGGRTGVTVQPAGGAGMVKIEIINQGAHIRDGGRRTEGGVDIQRLIVSAVTEDVAQNGPASRMLETVFNLQRRSRLK